MPTTYYYTVNNEIIAEHTLGQSRLDYVTDALGSVIATVDQTLTVQSTARYKPYGATLASTGADLTFGYTGSTGSRTTGRPHTDLYNWNRHLGSVDGRWTTVDPLWPGTQPYSYCRSNPASLTDPFGLSPAGRPAGNVTCSSQWNAFIYQYCNECFQQNPFSDPTGCKAQCSTWANDYYNACGKPTVPPPILGFPPYNPPHKPGPWGPISGPWGPPSEIAPIPQPKLPPGTNAPNPPPCDPACEDYCFYKYQGDIRKCLQDAMDSGVATLGLGLAWCEAQLVWSYWDCLDGCKDGSPPPYAQEGPGAGSTVIIIRMPSHRK